MIRPYQDFSDPELVTEIRDRTCEIMQRATASLAAVEAWARSGDEFTRTMRTVAASTRAATRLLRYAAYEAFLRKLRNAGSGNP